jgi:hypothetical protein
MDPMSAAQEAELRKLVAEGQIEQAMRRYSKLTGRSLAQAALWVSAVAESLGGPPQQDRNSGA